MQPLGHATVGDEIELFPVRGDITWNAAGNAWDTPKGMWHQNADFPWNTTVREDRQHGTQCIAEFFIESADYYGWTLYVPLVVNPVNGFVAPQGPTTSRVQHLGGNRYRITGTGQLKFDINFPATYGHYYPMYGGNGTGSAGGAAGICYASKGSPQPTAAKVTADNSGAEYKANFAAVDMRFSIEAGEAVQPPGTPTIIGPDTGMTDESHEFSFTATDPSDRSIAYQIDWDGNGVADQRVPGGTTYVQSGTTQSKTRTWSVAGSKEFRVRTENESGLHSGWASHSITIEDPEGVELTFEASVNGGSFSASDQTVHPDDTVDLRWTSDANECIGTNFDTSDEANNSGMNIDTPEDQSMTTFSIECTRDGFIAESWITIAASSVPAPVVVFEHDIGFLWDDNDRTITADQEFQVRWDAEPATTCVGINGVNTAGATSSMTSPLTVQGPSAGDSQTYAIRCTNQVGASTADTLASFHISAQGAVSAELEVSVDRGSWQSSDVTVSEDSNVRLFFNSTGADECTGNNFSTDGLDEGVVNISDSLPKQNSTRNYELTCTNAAGNSDSSELSVTVSNLPDLQPQNFSTPMIEFDNQAGDYDLTLIFDITNVGLGRISGGYLPADHKVELDIGNDGVINRSSALKSKFADPGDHKSFAELFRDIPFGTINRAIITADTSFPQARTDNNVIERTFGLLAPPDPNMELTVSSEFIRSGNTAEVTWNTIAEYELACTLRGPGIETITFNPAVDGPTGTVETEPLTSLANYLLTCRHETGAEYTADATVEVITTPVEI
jgi:hypothetical protein